MGKKLILMVLLLAFLNLISCASGHQENALENQPQLRELASIEKRLKQAVEENEALSLDLIGEVTNDDGTFPLWSVSYNQSVISDNTRLLICAGIHGNEPAAVETALQFIEKLSSDENPYSSMSIDILPVVNPWGWSRDVRFNREGLDLNRDFVNFASQEATIIEAYLEDNKYDLIIDCHEDPDASGFYLYQYGNRDQANSRSVIESVRDFDFPIEQDVNMVILKTDDGLIDAPLWGLWYMKLTRQLSMANFMRLYNSKYVYTVETPTAAPLEKQVEIQLHVLSELINAL
jgi:murein peptide amidase A